MYRYFLALAVSSALAACSGGNPNDAGNDEGVGTGAQPLIDEPQPTTVDEEPDPTPTVDETDPFGNDLDDDLSMNDVEFDTTTGELVLNNLPFDGEDNLYARDAAASAALASAGSNFDAYRNVGGANNYYAVFRQTATGYSRATAVGTDNYIEFGFGGLAAQRLEGTGALPNANQEYVFTGEYAAVRTVLDDEDTVDPVNGSIIQYVAGTIRIDVDIEDFDDTGAVEGIVTNRAFFDANGIAIPDLTGTGEFITLRTADINFDTWTINASSATAVLDNEAGASGTWEGIFAGPNGEEVAGIVFIEGSGPIGIDPDSGEYVMVQVRESGGFVASR